MSLELIPPSDLGLPEKFTQFRKPQAEAAEWITESDKRFFGACFPTGNGKSLLAMLLAKLTGMKTAILTSTKSLQEQYLEDFREAGLVDIRGRQNYPCQDGHKDCKQGAMRGCRNLNNGCVYETQRTRALDSEVLVTNYSYWLLAAQGLGDIELLILDEGHNAFEELGKAMKVSLYESRLKRMGLDYDKSEDSLQYWVRWAELNHPSLSSQFKEMKKELKLHPRAFTKQELEDCEELVKACESLLKMNSEDWVCDIQLGTNHGRIWNFDCVWPGSWSESKLFRGAKKVVIMSATIRPATMTMLGIKPDRMEFREWERAFPAQNTPVYLIQDGVRMRYGMSEEDWEKWLELIDQIIESRPGTKGVIHTVSYKRQSELMSKSNFRIRMIANTNDPESDGAREVCRQFKEAKYPVILVSPSFSTGWDLPEADWIIISKVAFPETTSKVMKARKEKNPRYPLMLAAQDLVQAAGRGTRTPKCKTEVFVVDTQLGWFYHHNRKLFPEWFEVRKVTGVPK